VEKAEAADGALVPALQAALAAGEASRAFGLCEARLAAWPEDAEAHRQLALLQAAAGKPGLARRSGRRACELAPDDPRCWADLGRVHAIGGDLAGAARCFAEAVAVDPRHVDGWHNLGLALRRQGRRSAAFDAFKRALLLDPARAETYLALGSLLVEASQFEDALECFERAARHDPGLPRARSRLAGQLSLRGKVKRAEALFRQSLGLDPDHVEGWFGLGRALEDLGEADGARAAYLNALQRRPGHAPALGQYLALAREADGANEPLAAWRAHADTVLYDDGVPDRAKALVGYGLAKHHDRRGDPAAAAAAGIAANAARRRHAGPLDRQALAARIDRTIATYTADFFVERRRFGLGNDQPVFVVGLPRSGTTLTEQILSAHPALHGAGELPDLARLAVRQVGEADEPWQAALRLDAAASRAAAGQYLKGLRDGAPKGRLRISDKSPLNFFHLAFAALLFPGARVVHCRRGLRDNALSVWLENFDPEQRWATDFDDLAFYAAQYRRLMAHWREVLPLAVLELRYEDTVADLEAQARRLIGFLGAPWDARCLDFHSQRRAVQTPSRWQVRQPIYDRSVGRWRAYAAHLPALDAAFRAFDDA